MREDVKNIFKKILEEVAPFHKLFKTKLLEIDDDYIKMFFPFREDFIGDPRGKRLHGGYVSVIADITGGAAAMTKMTSPDDNVATIDLRIDYLKPGKAKDVIAEAKVVKSGTRIIVVDVNIYQGEKEDLIAIARGSFNIWRK